MITYDLLRDDIMKLPKSCNFDYFPKYIEGVFSKYIKILDSLDIDDPLSKEVYRQKEKIEDICDRLQVTINLYFDGRIHQSYDVFQKIMEYTFKHFKFYLKQLSPEGYEPLKHLFRVVKKGRKENYIHVPFENRTKIKNNRYSINGLPCLYLGSSVYSCFLESNLENESDFYNLEDYLIAKFEIKNGTEVNLLDYAYTPEFLSDQIERKAYRSEIKEKIDKKLTSSILESQYIDFNGTNNAEELIEEVISVFLNWPIIAASSIKVKEQTSFIPEYIIPQFLCEWVRTTKCDIDGIKYFSTKIRAEEKSKNISLFQNYAFPVKAISETGYCSKLLSKFNISELIECKSCENEPSRNLKDEREVKILGKVEKYRETIYGRIESKFDSKKMEDNGNDPLCNCHFHNTANITVHSTHIE